MALRTRQIIILLIFTTCLILAKKHHRKVRKHRHRAMSITKGALICFNGRDYQENNCNHCVCKNGELVMCSRNTCDDSHFYKNAKICKVGAIWKEDCNTCQCARFYGTVCTIKNCLGVDSDDIDFGDPDEGVQKIKPTLYIQPSYGNPLLLPLKGPHSSTDNIQDMNKGIKIEVVTPITDTDRVTDVTNTNHVTKTNSLIDVKQAEKPTTETSNIKVDDTAEVSPEKLASRMLLPDSFEDEYTAGMIKPRIKRIPQGRLKRYHDKALVRKRMKVGDVEKEV